MNNVLTLNSQMSRKSAGCDGPSFPEGMFIIMPLAVCSLFVATVKGIVQPKITIL